MLKVIVRKISIEAFFCKQAEDADALINNTAVEFSLAEGPSKIVVRNC